MTRRFRIAGWLLAAMLASAPAIAGCGIPANKVTKSPSFTLLIQQVRAALNDEDLSLMDAETRAVSVSHALGQKSSISTPMPVARRRSIVSTWLKKR